MRYAVSLKQFTLTGVDRTFARKFLMHHPQGGWASRSNQRFSRWGSIGVQNSGGRPFKGGAYWRVWTVRSGDAFPPLHE